MNILREQHRFIVITIGAVSATVLPSVSQAYVGPGAGLTVLGTVLAFVAALGLAIVGFVWYPIKRLRKWGREKKKAKAPDVSPK